MARELRRKGFKKIFIISEGVDKAGATSAMQKAGFMWQYGNKLVKFDSQGKVVQKIPLQ